MAKLLTGKFKHLLILNVASSGKKRVMEQETIKAHPRYRKVYFILLLGLILLGAVMIKWGLPIFQWHLWRIELHRAMLIVRIVLIVTFAPCVIFSIYWFVLARRILTSQQYPAPRMAVLRDTKVVRGPESKPYAIKAFILSGILLLISAIGMFYIPYMLTSRF